MNTFPIPSASDRNRFPLPHGRNVGMGGRRVHAELAFIGGLGFQ